MTYRKKHRNISLHQKYYSNPLNHIHSITNLLLMMYSNKYTKRNSPRAKYRRIRKRKTKIYRYDKNPLKNILFSKNERKVLGKFNI